MILSAEFGKNPKPEEEVKKPKSTVNESTQKPVIKKPLQYKEDAKVHQISKVYCLCSLNAIDLLPANGRRQMTMSLY